MWGGREGRLESRVGREIYSLHWELGSSAVIDGGGCSGWSGSVNEDKVVQNDLPTSMLAP